MFENKIIEAVDNICIPKSSYNSDSDGEKIVVKRGKVDSIKIYEVSESELTTMIVSNLVRNFDSEKSHKSIMLR